MSSALSILFTQIISIVSKIIEKALLGAYGPAHLKTLTDA